MASIQEIEPFPKTHISGAYNLFVDYPRQKRAKVYIQGLLP